MNNRGSYWTLTSASKLHLTWNDRDSFQCSENSECSQRRYIPQVHKLCYISEIREDHTQTPMTTTNTPRTPPRQWTTRRYGTHRACPLQGEKEGKENQENTPREHRPDPSRPNTLLPGITEIVFNALRTLNVRRAETLPRFTNSVIYLQWSDQSYMETWSWLSTWWLPYVE